jgi:hypothetical protein
VATEEDVNLEDLTKSELQDKAEEVGADWSAADSKSELIDKINEAEEPSDDDDEEGADEEEVGEDQTATSYASEEFPERRPIEVDIKDVEVADYEGEITPPFNGETFVILDGASDDVPNEMDGAVAAMIDWPVSVEHDHHTGTTITYDPPEGVYIVKELSQGIRLSVTKDAFKKVSTNGRAGLVGFA